MPPDTTLPNHFTFEVNEQDWQAGIQDGFTHAPVRCAVWQAIVRTYPKLANHMYFGVSKDYIYDGDELWNLDSVGRDLITCFDFRESQYLPVVVEATRYVKPLQ